MKRPIGLVLALVALLTSTVLLAGCAPRTDDQHDRAVALRNNDAPDATQAPGKDDQASGDQPLTAGASRGLYSNQIRTRHLMDGTITQGKVAFKAVTVNVNAAAATGSSAADPALVSGFLVGCHPATNQDQFVDNIVLNGDGSITITLAANATAQNVFRCVAVKANAQGTT